jgi:flap endonuclease-1
VNGLGVDLGEIIPKRRMSIDELPRKALAVDAYNALYQFLAIIRQPNGTPLMDRQHRITSHLSGLLYRTSNLAERGVKLVYVFDGEPPELKEIEVMRRRRVKEEALVKYEAALKEGRLEEARKYAQMTSQLKDTMVEDAKRLLTAMGVPWVQAPSEGEAQAAYIAIRGDVWAVASQDHDSLLFGAPRLVRNLTVTGRRKLPRKDVYIEVEPEIVELNQVLSELGITRDQLVDIGILIGTDFNPDGVKGIGPKTALKLLKKHGSLERVLQELKEAEFPEDPLKIREIFLRPKVSADYKIEWREPNVNEVVNFLCGERDFSEERVRNALEKMVAGMREVKEKTTLEAFFG